MLASVPPVVGGLAGRVSRTCKIQSKLLLNWIFFFFFFFKDVVVKPPHSLFLSLFDQRRSCLIDSSSGFHHQGKIPQDHPLERRLGLSGTRNSASGADSIVCKVADDAPTVTQQPLLNSSQ